jgi:hypothetical protein
MKLKSILKLSVIVLMSSFLTAVQSQANLCPQVSVNPGQVKLAKAKRHKFKVSVIHEQTANSLFKHIKSMKNIPYKYVVDGCDVRAYLAAKDLKERWNIESFRANLESYPNMAIKTAYTQEEWVEFSKHSALAMCVYNPSSGKVNPLVLDAAFFNRPVSTSNWMSSLKDEFSDKAPKIYFSGMYNLNPEERYRNSFSSSELRCAEEVRGAFMKEQRKIERGNLPYGIGRSKEVLRENLCL